jgi:hypothetical protein
VNQLRVFTDFRKTYDLFRKKVLKYIIIEFGIKINYNKKKMFSNESYGSPGRQNFLTHLLLAMYRNGGSLLPRRVHYAVEYVVRRVQAEYDWLK